MIYFVLSAIVGAGLYLLLSNRQISNRALVTIAGLLVLFVAGVAAMIALQSTTNTGELRRAEAAREFVVLRDVKVGVDPLLSSNPPQYFKAEGWVHNKHTDKTLSSMKLRVRMQRCADETAQSCETVGEETTVLRLIVPPEQSRAFGQTVVIRNAPPLEKARWQVDVIDADFR